MLFKTEQIETDWKEKIALSARQENFHTWRLIDVVTAIDKLCVAAGFGEITITSFYREPTAKRSFHPLYQAVDIRAHNKSEKWWQSMKYLKFMLRNFNPQIQLVLHEELRGTPNEHLHLEIDTGNPVSKEV